MVEVPENYSMNPEDLAKMQVGSARTVYASSKYIHQVT